MAIRKVCGIETEYGIAVRGADSNPVAASSRADQRLHRHPRPTDGLGLRGREPGHRRPRLRGRGRAAARRRDPPREHRAHQRRPLLRRPRPPRGLDARVRRRPRRSWSGRPCRGGGRSKRSMVAARSMLPDGAEIVVYKNNSDGKGTSYGCHENYLVARELPFGRLVTPDHPALRDPPGLLRRRARWGASRPACRRARCRSSSASGRTSSRRRSGSRPPSSARSSTPGTNRTATGSATAASTSSSATPTAARWPRS